MVQVPGIFFQFALFVESDASYESRKKSTVSRIRLGFPVYKAAEGLFVLRFALASPPLVPTRTASEPAAEAGGKASPVIIPDDGQQADDHTLRVRVHDKI